MAHTPSINLSELKKTGILDEDRFGEKLASDQLKQDEEEDSE